MSNIAALFNELQQLNASSMLTDARIEQMIQDTDPANHKQFLAVEGGKDLVGMVCNKFVHVYLNNPNTDEVPLRRKTRILLVMNNFALNRTLRSHVMNGIKDMTSVFEDSMKREGTMPFDSELGRMSEHVLVLLMRVTSYKLKASQVHEFAENNTQFAVQLLLAILLKEPAYEFELRCNCLTGLQGFTQPQAFFQAGEGTIEFNSCNKFNEKVDFINSLMLRLSALQVVADVLATPLIEHPSVTPLVHIGVTSTMRCVMNIFQFSSTGNSQWRQHILLSTTFVDGVAVLYVHAQLRALEGLLSSRVANLPIDLMNGVALALKFMAFATFHMGRHGRMTRPLCGFIPELLDLDFGHCMSTQTPTLNQIVQIYTQLFYFLSNIDALSGDVGMEADLEDSPELTSSAIKQSLQRRISSLAAIGGNALLDMFHHKFYSVDTDALVAQDGETFQVIDQMFYSAKEQVAPTAPAIPAEGSRKHFGDMPALKAPNQQTKQPVSQAVAQPVEIQQAFVAPKRLTALAQGNPYACALNGHTMKCPMLSPYGHNFEKETIEQWIRQQGSVCPITGKPLSLTDLQPNKALQAEIMQQIVAATLASRTNHEDDGDLYDF